MADSDIILDHYVLQDSGKAGSSLTDLNEIPVFTTKFQEKVTAAERTQKRQETFLKGQPFVQKMGDVNTDEVTVAQLFQGVNMQRVKEEEAAPKTNFMMVYSMLILFFAVFGAGMLLYWQKRRQKTARATQDIEETFTIED